MTGDAGRPQRGVTEGPDQGERTLPPRHRLGIENRVLAGVLGLVLDLRYVHRTAIFVATRHPAATLATGRASLRGGSARELWLPGSEGWTRRDKVRTVALLAGELWLVTPEGGSEGHGSA